VLFTAVFALVFINLYSPFGVDSWYDVTEPQLFLYSSLVILTGLLIIALSRIIMHLSTRKRGINNGTYILWIAAEIVSLAVVYLILQQVFISESTDLLDSFRKVLKITALVLLFPYTLSYLYFSWLEKNKKLSELEKRRFSEEAQQLSQVQKMEQIKHMQQLPQMLPFRDERGELRFSLQLNDLLYLEAADNYVSIHYVDRGKEATYLIRNSLKNMEENFSGTNIVRCHRSYMVNFDKVKIIRRERDGLVLELDMKEKGVLPISATYVDDVMRLFSKYSGS
jgi:hypothetical protein